MELSDLSEAQNRQLRIPHTFARASLDVGLSLHRRFAAWMAKRLCAPRTMVPKHPCAPWGRGRPRGGRGGIVRGEHAIGVRNPGEWSPPPMARGKRGAINRPCAPRMRGLVLAPSIWERNTHASRGGGDWFRTIHRGAKHPCAPRRRGTDLIASGLAPRLERPTIVRAPAGCPGPA